MLLTKYSRVMIRYEELSYLSYLIKITPSSLGGHCQPGRMSS